MMSAMRRAIVRAISSYSTITKGTRSLEAGISEVEKARYKFTLYVRTMLVLALVVRIASDNGIDKTKEGADGFVTNRQELFRRRSGPWL
jgi:hypothetical protein